MIINFRYHVFTITAIFAALGLGILIGSSFIGHEGLIEEQKKIINNIGSDIKQLRTENYELKSNLDNLEKELVYHRNLQIKLLPLVFRDKLIDKEYLLVYTQKSEYELVKQFTELLTKAGLKINILDNIKKVDVQTTGKIILWNVNPREQETFTKFNDSLNTKPLIYNGDDISGLVLKIIEDLENKVIGDKNEIR